MEEIAGCILLAFFATFVLIKMVNTNNKRKRESDDGDEEQPKKKYDQTQRLQCICVPCQKQDSESGEYDKILQPKGIPNIGSTCFMSSILQCLCWCPGLDEQLAEEVQRNAESKQFGIAKCLRMLMEEMHKSRSSIQRKTVNNLLMAVRRSNPQFDGYDQQDSFELYNTIISGIEEEGCSQEENKLNFVSRLFSGTFMTVYFYEECGHVDVVFQNFTSLTLPFPNDIKGKKRKRNIMPKESEVNQVMPNNRNRMNTVSPVGQEKWANKPLSTSSLQIEMKVFCIVENVDERQTQNDGSDLPVQSSQTYNLACLTPQIQERDTSLEKGLRILTQEESFSTDKLPCRDCEKDANETVRKTGNNGRCYKRLLLAKLPPVLVLHMSRFRQDGHAFRKITDPLNFTCELDLQRFCALSDILKQEHSTKYSLFGIVCHIGNLQGGHYYSYIKTPRRNASSINKAINNPEHGDLVSRKQDIIKCLIKHLSDGRDKKSVEKAEPHSCGGNFCNVSDWDATTPSKSNVVHSHEAKSGTTWFYTSDSHVSEVSEEKVLKDTNAYMLMYEKNNSIDQHTI